MDQDVRDEFKRLEDKIDSFSRNLSSGINKLALEAKEMNVVKEKQRNFESVIATILSNIQESTTESRQLRESISKLSETIATMNGDANGASRVKRLAWTLFGGLIIAAIIGATTTLVMLREKVIELETKLVQLEKVE